VDSDLEHLVQSSIRAMETVEAFSLLDIPHTLVLQSLAEGCMLSLLGITETLLDSGAYSELVFLRLFQELHKLHL